MVSAGALRLAAALAAIAWVWPSRASAASDPVVRSLVDSTFDDALTSVPETTAGVS